MPKLTETFVSKLPLAKEGTAKHWDTKIKGRVLFVGKASKTWYFQKDVGGQTRRVMTGRNPAISASAARDTAVEFMLEWGRGAGKAIQIRAPTLRKALDAYLARPKLGSEVYKNLLRQQFGLCLKNWMRLPLTEIKKAMVVERHRSLAETPSGANQLLKYVRTVWNHARRTYDLPESPTMAIEWFKEQPNGEVIEDLKAWRRAIDVLPNPIHQVFYEFILATGLRKTEAFTLEWKHVQGDRIHLPMTKNGRAFDLPIVPKHLDILEPVRGLGKRWVFPSRKSETQDTLGDQCASAGAPTRTAGPLQLWPWKPGFLRRSLGVC